MLWMVGTTRVSTDLPGELCPKWQQTITSQITALLASLPRRYPWPSAPGYLEVPRGTCGYPSLGTCRYLRCLWVSPAFCTVVFWAPLLSPESSPHLVNFFVAFLFTISASAPCFCSAQLNSTTHQVLSLLTCLKTFSLPPTSPSHNRGILVVKRSITAGFSAFKYTLSLGRQVDD